MAIDLGSAAATLSLDVGNFVTNAQKAEQAMQGIQSASNSVSGDGGFLNWVNQNEQSLTRWGKGMLAVGGIITGAFAAPIIAGSKAAWGQVDAVEQATIAMNAYADSTEQVDTVLADLLAYARSDMGVLFSRQELFSAAQSMLIYGASIEDVTGYTEILSRSVGLGLSNWDDLNTIIGRVGSTGRLTGNDFDMLKARGFDLDESLRNTNITWEELFMHLDKGIPADALAGQAETIRGKSIRLQSALRGLGLAFLGVDSETSKFIEGGLGWQMMRGMENLTTLMKRAAPAVQNLGSIFASILKPIGSLIDFMLRLPQPVQTAILMFTALSGVALTAGGSFLLLLPRIASTVTALQAMGGLTGILGGVTKAIGALRVAMLAVFANPLLLAGIAIIGAAILAYKTNFFGFADAVDGAMSKVARFFEILTGGPSQKTVSFEIDSLTDEDWDGWQQMPDGSWKNAELGITAHPDDMTIFWQQNQDGSTTYRVVITTEAGPQDGEILQSIRDPNKSNLIRMQIRLDNGEEIWGIYDEYSGAWTTIPATIEVTVNDGKAREDMTWWERIADNLNKGWSAFALVWQLHINPALNNASQILDNLARVAERFISAGIDGFTTIADLIGVKMAVAIDTVQEKWDSFSDVVSSTWDTISSTAESIIRGIQSLVEEVVGAIMAVVDAANDGINTVIDLANKIPGVNISPVGGGDEEGDGGGVRTKRENYSQTSTSPMDFKNLTAGGPAFGLGQAFKDIADNALEASSAIGKTTAATVAASPSFQSLQSVIGTSASTASGFSGTMNTTASTTAAAGSRMGTTFASIASSALSNFSAANSNATSQSSAMASAVGGHFLGMQTRAAVQMALMASTASSSGTQMNTGLTGWMAGATARIAAGLASMVASVRNAGGSGYSAGYYAGSQIGAGMAAGMYAYLGQISAAANAMVNSAAAAVRARAMISSPSRLFKKYGAFIGEGMELGILGKVDDVRHAGQMLVPSPSLNMPIANPYSYGGGSTIVNQYQETKVYTLTSAEWLAQQDAIAAAPERTVELIHKARSIAGGMN